MNYAYNEDLMLAAIAEYKRETRIQAEAQNTAKAISRIPNRCHRIATRASEMLGVTVEGALSKRHNRELVQARRIIVLVLRRCYGYSLGRLGYLLNRHHTTILSLEQEGSRDYHQSEHFRDVVNAIAGDIGWAKISSFAPCGSYRGGKKRMQIPRVKCSEPGCQLLIRTTNLYGRCKDHSEKLYAAKAYAKKKLREAA